MQRAKEGEDDGHTGDRPGEGRGVRGADARHIERGGRGAYDLGRPQDRPLRRHGRARPAPARASDPTEAGACAERMLGPLNEAAVALMTSVGHRTGLFDAMAGLAPSTSGQIAAAAGLDERYVREWLGAMVTGGIVEHDPDDGTYVLPPEHARWLTRAASPENIAVTAQWIPLLGSVEDGIVESFREGGGVPYSAYPRFHEVMAEESAQTVVAALTRSILPLVPGLTDRLEAGIDVLDLGCGSGRALTLMARTYPKSRFAGCDISGEGIARARGGAHGPAHRRV